MHEATPSDYAPTTWLVVFHVTTGKPWLDRLLPGRFKHVSALAWCEDAACWVFYEPAYRRTQVYLAGAEAGDKLAGRMMNGNAVLRVPVQEGSPALPRFGFWCSSAIAHLLGIRGGPLPSSLYKACLAIGATTVQPHEPDESLNTRAAGADA